MEFDLFITLVCVVIALTSAGLIYAIAQVTMKGASYDDIKASRRLEKNQPTQIDHTIEAKKLKKMKKKLKKESNKENINALSSQNTVEESPSEGNVTPPSEEQSDPPSVEIANTEIIVEKPILVNKMKNKIKVSKKAKVPESKEPTIVKSPELQTESKTESKAENKNEVNSLSLELPSKPDVTLENDAANNSPDEDSAVSQESAKSKKKPKKKKGECPPEESGKLTLQSLLPLLKQAEFSHGEVQILIDALLNKNESEWLKGKQDPMLKLKKQLIEMEKLHTDDTETINGLQVKLTSLRSELNSEKSISKGLRDAMTKSNHELQALSLKFQQLSEEKEALLINIQQLKQQVNEEHMIVIKMQEERLLFSQMNISHEQHHEAVIALQSQVNQLAAQITEEQTLNANLAAQLDESMRIEEECRQVNNLNVELDHLLSNSQMEVNRLNTELVALSKQLDDSRTQINEITAMMENTEAQKTELQTENEHLKVEISKANRDALAYQKMADSMEHNLEENKKNGSIHFHNEHSECQSLLDEKDQVIKNLNKDMSQKEVMVEKLKTDVINCKNDSNKKQTMIENLNVELSYLKSIGVKVTGELDEEKNVASTLRVALAEKSESIDKLSKEIDTYKHRNNELRSKNWKVVEALEKAEASLKELSSGNSCSAVVDDGSLSKLKCRINFLMQPLILPKKLDFSKIEDNDLWLAKFEEIINNININKDSSSEEIIAQNTKLQGLVTHYRSVISDLEKILSELEDRIASAYGSQVSITQPEIDVED